MPNRADGYLSKRRADRHVPCLYKKYLLDEPAIRLENRVTSHLHPVHITYITQCF